MRDGRWMATMAALAVAAVVGCGGNDGEQRAIPQGVDGAVVFRDAMDDNGNGWLDILQTPFRGGVWVWNDVPTELVAAVPDALVGKRLPAGVAVSIRVEQREGAALRMVACRESGEDGSRNHVAYQLGIDGRQAVIRMFREKAPFRVLARKRLDVANGTTVTLNGRCVPTGDGALALTLLVDGKVAVQTRHDEPLPNGDVALHATARGDTDRSPSLTWDDFVVREVRSAS